MFGKWFASTYTGSMLGAGSDVFAVWSWVIANAGPKGVLEINPALLAAMIGEPVEAISKAVDYLCAPDANSRSKDEDGRRLVHLEAFTYQVVNHAQYREARNAEARREYKSRKQREYRAKDCPPKSTVDSVDRGGPKTEDRSRRQSSEAVNLTSEPSGIPTEYAHSPKAPVALKPHLRAEGTTGVAKAPQDGTSQASVAVAVVPTYIPEAYEAASYLIMAIQSHKPDFCAPRPKEWTNAYEARIRKKLTGWTKHLDLLIRLDGKSLDEVRHVIDFCHRSDDPFERANILSGFKLRKRWDQLSIKANTANQSQARRGAPVLVTSQVDAAERWLTE